MAAAAAAAVIFGLDGGPWLLDRCVVQQGNNNSFSHTQTQISPTYTSTLLLPLSFSPLPPPPASLPPPSPFLGVLQVDGNALRGRLPSEFGLLRDLRVLSLADNSVIGPIPTELGQLSQIGESATRKASGILSCCSECILEYSMILLLSFFSFLPLCRDPSAGTHNAIRPIAIRVGKRQETS